MDTRNSGSFQRNMNEHERSLSSTLCPAPYSFLAQTLSDLLVHVLGDLDVCDGGGVLAEHVHMRVHDAHVLWAVARFRQRRCKGERRVQVDPESKTKQLGLGRDAISLYRDYRSKTCESRYPRPGSRAPPARRRSCSGHTAAWNRRNKQTFIFNSRWILYSIYLYIVDTRNSNTYFWLRVFDPLLLKDGHIRLGQNC